ADRRAPRAPPAAGSALRIDRVRSPPRHKDPTMIRLLYPDASFNGEPDVERAVAGEGVEITVRKLRSPDPIPPASWAQCDAVIMTRMDFGEAELKTAPRCRIVVRMGVGYDTVDLEACGRRGVAVC